MDRQSPESPVERRLVALEVKLSYLEDLTDQLNGVIVRQQGDIDRLLAAVQALGRQAAQSDDAGSFRSLRDELPPHY